MPTERSSAGDPTRTIDLLWRAQAAASRRGPERGLDVDAVISAAIEIAGRDGLVGVSMRRIAGALDVATMTLYTYVPGKAELLDLMLDTVYARMPRTDTGGQPWRDRLREVAEGNRTLFKAHPWAATVSTMRPPLGPGLMAKYEHELSALDGLGLDDVQIDDSLTYLLSFVQAAARARLDARGAEQDSAMDDERWWAANAPLLARVLDEDAFPLASRIGAAAGAAQASALDPEHAYDFGLERVLDGLATLIEGRDREPLIATTTHSTPITKHKGV